MKYIKLYFCVVAPSHPPSDVNANNISSTGITVNWRKVPREYRNGNILGYRVRLAPLSDPSQFTVHNYTAKERSANFSQLLKFSSYTVQVLAFTVVGDGTPSAPVTVTTDQDGEIFNPRSLLEKIVTRSIGGGGGQSDPPSTFDTTHPIDLKFGTHNKHHLYFQLIGFHGHNSQINDVTVGRHLGFSNFQILFKFSLLCLRMTGKQHLAVDIHEIGRIHCEVVNIS